jgi:hypothetical protein
MSGENMRHPFVIEQERLLLGKPPEKPVEHTLFAVMFNENRPFLYTLF